MVETALNEVALPALHPAQCEVVESPARFKVMAAGRRWGKTLYEVWECTKRALEGKRCWWVAPTFRIGQVGWRSIRSLARQIPGTEIRESEDTVTYPGGGVVQVRSADNPDSLRGEGLDFVVLDEAAYMPECAWTEALRPALADRRGSALFGSTPRGRNWFYRLWERTESLDNWAHWKFPTTTNPYIDPAEIELAHKMLPERVFLQEFMAEFVEDAGLIFRRITEAAIAVPQEWAIKGHEYAMGVDWGKHEDFTVIIVLDITTHSMAYMDRFNQIDYSLQRERLKVLCRRFQPRRILGERNAMGEPIIEDLRRDGLDIDGYSMNQITKPRLIDALSLAFEQGQIKILPDEQLLAELRAFETERLPSGILRYSAPEGMHDDCVIALALAWNTVAIPSFMDFLTLSI